MNDWNASLYEDRHAFVYHFGSDLIDLLAPRPGERILDVGCGTGHLTAKLAAAGASVVGIDASREMIEQARRNFPQLEFQVADARNYAAAERFDAVFSNAALHWITPPHAAARSIAAALRPGGRFVAEFGGRGNVRQILAAIEAAAFEVLAAAMDAINPWYFPDIAEYAALLAEQGLEVRMALLFDRPTPLEEGEQGMANWLAMFGQPCLANVPAEHRSAVTAAAIERMRPHLCGAGQWTADYRRLRVVAAK